MIKEETDLMLIVKGDDVINSLICGGNTNGKRE